MTVDTKYLIWALVAITCAVLADVFLIHLLTGSWGG